MIRLEPLKARPSKRAPYRGGTSIEATKPWLKEDPPMGRRTWYRKRKEARDYSLGTRAKEAAEYEEVRNLGENDVHIALGRAATVSDPIARRKEAKEQGK